MLIYRFIIFIYLFKNLELKEIKSYNNFLLKSKLIQIMIFYFFIIVYIIKYFL